MTLTPMRTGPVDPTTSGLKAMGVVGTIVLGALLALAVCASSASAEPLSMTFTDSRANVGVQLADEPLFGPPATAPFTAQIDPGSGLIAAGVLQVPQFSMHIDDPIEADVTVDFEIGVITGSFNRSNGALSLSGTAGGILTSQGVETDQCTVSVPGFLTVTTAGSSGGASPRSGVPFAHGLTGAGAIAGQWGHMDAEPVSETPTADEEWFCGHVENQIGGPGGVWLQHQGDIVPPAAPQLTSTHPASPNASGTPRIRGAAEAGSQVSIYAGANCTGPPVAAGSAAELGAPGIPVWVPEGVTSFFSATATDPAGNASGCSAPVAYTRLKPPTDPGGDDGDTPPACVVPKLVGKTLKRAKRALRAANCKLGKVKKPKKWRKRKGKKRRVLVVRSSSPRRGARPADGKVDVKLRPKPRKAKRGPKRRKARR